jgi:hypothetical protein
MKEPMMRAMAWIGTATLVVALSGCGSDADSGAASSYSDGSVKTGYPLGWLGGRAHPATSVVKVPDPDRAGATLATGGMVVMEVHGEGGLASAGAERGDVIVKVGDTWVPNKEDPGLDLYRLVESEVSAGLAHIRLSVLRDGKMTTILVDNDREPLEVGGPGASERLAAAGRAGLDHLATDDGGDADISATSLTGLAFIAAGPDAYPTEVDRCAERVNAAITDEGRSMSTWDAAWATLFLAELAGPLAIETPTVRMATGPMTIGEGMPAGTIVGEPRIISADELPEGIEISEDATGGTMTFSTSGGDEMPDLSEMMESGNVQVMMVGPRDMPGATPDAAAPETEEIDGPLWTSEQLGALAGPEAVAKRATLTRAVERLVAMQGEDGGWDDPDSTGYSDRTIVTNQVLMALGAAERAGVAVDNTAIRSGLSYIRSHTNDGHVFAVEEAGFDRRREAGRSGGAAAALIALNCVDGDEFHGELMAYSGEHGKTVIESSSGVPLHVFNTAILRRHQGRVAWATWFDEFRHCVVGMQDPDGSFAALPTVDADAPTAQLDADATSRTALWSLCALMSSDHLPILCAKAENPLQTAMDSTGARVAGGPPAGMTGAPSMDQEQIMKMLEGMELPAEVREAIENGDFEVGGGGDGGV